MIVKQNTVSAYHIANNEVQYNPQRKNNFMLIIRGLENLKRVGAAADSTTNLIENGQEEIKLALKTCDVPQFTNDSITINRGNSQIKFAGKPTFDDIQFSAYDYIGSNVKDTLLAWQQLCYNSTYDYIGRANSYKKQCVLYEYTPDWEPVRYWNIKGAFPTRVEIDDFDMSSSDEVMVNVTLSIDWAEMHLPDDAVV